MRCEVVDIEPKTFKKAIKNFNISKNTLEDKPSKESEVVYSVKLLLKDKSVSANQQLEVVLFSWDGKGADLLPEVDLRELQYSSLSYESQLYEEKVNQLLEETSGEKPAIATLEYVPVNSKQGSYRLLRIC